MIALIANCYFQRHFIFIATYFYSIIYRNQQIRRKLIIFIPNKLQLFQFLRKAVHFVNNHCLAIELPALLLETLKLCYWCNRLSDACRLFIRASILMQEVLLIYSEII